MFADVLVARPFSQALQKNQNKRENLKSHEQAEFSRLARCMISLKSTLIGCKITGFENSYACIIPTQFLWGQGSSVLTNKHTNSCSPPKESPCAYKPNGGKRDVRVYQSMPAKEEREVEAAENSTSHLSFL